MNLPFCLWIWARARLRGDDVRIMVHEPNLAFREGNLRQDAAALVHRLMTIILLLAAREIWVSIPRWETRWRPYALGRRIPFSWLPLPSNIPVAGNPEQTAAIRARYVRPGELLVGHFGTFGTPVASMLERIVPRILSRSEQIVILLIGPKGIEFRDKLAGQYPKYRDRLKATGPILAQDPSLSWHLSACDLMIQPFPDGASTRRTSLLAQLAHGIPTVTTVGPSTEELLATSTALASVPLADIDGFVEQVARLLADADARRRLSEAARELNDQHFSVPLILGTLRKSYAAK